MPYLSLNIFIHYYIKHTLETKYQHNYPVTEVLIY